MAYNIFDDILYLCYLYVSVTVSGCVNSRTADCHRIVWKPIKHYILYRYSECLSNSNHVIILSIINFNIFIHRT